MTISTQDFTKATSHRSSPNLLDYALEEKFGDVHCFSDVKTGLQAIIAIHNTKLGPALGGCRFIEYARSDLAIIDAMRLAKGMSYKSALAKLPLGGGKAVIIKPKGFFDRKAYFHHFGKLVDSLQGRYITALDSGTLLSDMDIINQHTPFVASLSAFDGDPSFSTSVGMLKGIEAMVKFKLNQSNLKGLHVAIQGLGHVGYALAGLLHDRGVRLTVTDRNQTLAFDAKKNFGANVVSPEDIHKIPCDLFSPCALGACLNDKTIQELQTSMIAGAANNQLEQPIHGELLHKKDILYAPDYVVNAGGVIFACGKYHKTPSAVVDEQVDRIASSLTEIFERSVKESKPTSQVADSIAEERLA